jgi:hypothetical protein
MTHATRLKSTSAVPMILLAVGALSLAPVTAHADQLYSNGPLASVPGGGAGGMDASRLQTNLGMSTLGVGIDFANGTLRAVADDFTVPAPGWNLTRITVYGYQTDSGFTSSLNDLRLVIMNGPPNAPGSAAVYGNPASNVLAFTSFTSVFRDSQQSPGQSRRPIMSAAANVNVFLPPGTYWLVWALAGRLGDGPFVPPLTIPGQLTTGNGFHFTGGGWAQFRDSGTNTPQGFPFTIEGSLPGGGAGPTLTMATNGTTFRAGDRFVLSATLTAGASPVDAYVLFDLVVGGTMSLTSGGLVPGVVPLARGFTPVNHNAVLLDTALPAAPPGTYTVRGFLATPNTTVPVSSPSQISFVINP